MKYGYARVSTEDQTVNLQIDALYEAGCVSIFEDHGVSGADTSRPGLDELLGTLSEGDTVVVWRLDRLGRSLSHLIHLVDGFRDRGVGFTSLLDHIDTQTAAGELFFHLSGALAQFERRLISERTKAGMAAAKSRGTRLGRPRKLSGARISHAKELLAAGKSRREVCHILGVSQPTLWRALAL